MEVPISIWMFILWFNIFLICFLVCCAIWLYLKVKNSTNPLAKGA